MEEKYYSASDFQELSQEVYEATEAIKYLLTVPHENPDSKLRTAELVEAAKALAENCEEFLTAFNYHAKKL